MKAMKDFSETGKINIDFFKKFIYPDRTTEFKIFKEDIEKNIIEGYYMHSLLEILSYNIWYSYNKS